MGFFSGMGRGLRGMMDGAAGTQALLAGDYGAYGQLRGRQARLRTPQAAMEEERRQALIRDLLSRGLDPAQAELALANPDFARQFGSSGLAGAVVHAAAQDGFDRSSEIAIAQQRARETGRDYRDILREMRGLAHRPQLPEPVEAPARQIGKPQASAPRNAATARPVGSGSNPAPWRPGGRWNRQEVERQAANAIRMYKIHLERGMSPEHAAGWAANAQAESHGNFKESQPNGPGRGLFQWGSTNSRYDRRIQFQQQFGFPIDESSEEEQLAFRDWELAQPSFRDVQRRISRARTAGDIADAITRHYEIPDNPDQDAADRANIAEAILRLAQPR